MGAAQPIYPCPVRAVSSAVEHYVDIVGVTGSIPVPPTILNSQDNFYPLRASSRRDSAPLPQICPGNGSPRERIRNAALMVRMMVAIDLDQHLDRHAEVARELPRTRAVLHGSGRAGVAQHMRRLLLGEADALAGALEGLADLLHLRSLVMDAADAAEGDIEALAFLERPLVIWKGLNLSCCSSRSIDVSFDSSG